MHELSMRALAGGIVSQYRRAVALRLFILASKLEIHEQFIEHQQVHVLQTLTLEKNPVLVIAGQQVVVVKRNGVFQSQGFLGVKLSTRNSLGGCKCALKIGD